jgi:hypothetical protein
MASAIKSIQLVFPAQPIPVAFIFLKRKDLVLFGLGVIAAALLLLVVLVWRDIKQRERIAKDREDHGW